MQYQRKHVAIAAASGFEPRFLSLSNLASHPIHETQQPYPIGHAGLLDGASKLVFIETFICVGVHTCARALCTRERCDVQVLPML